MRKTQMVTLRVSVELLEKIDAVAKNRSKFFLEAAEKMLSAVPSVELTVSEKREVLKDAKTVTEIMREAMIQRLQKEQGLLDSMPKDEFLKLVMARLPKEVNPDGDLEEEFLSLKECLDGLPLVEDISRELNKVKGELYKAEKERDMNKALLEHGKGKKELGELMDLVYRSAVEYAVNLVARRSLPGFGDGGGLPDAEYGRIAEEVKKALEGLAVYRRGVE